MCRAEQGTIGKTMAMIKHPKNNERQQRKQITIFSSNKQHINILIHKLRSNRMHKTIKENQTNNLKSKIILYSYWCTHIFSHKTNVTFSEKVHLKEAYMHNKWALPHCKAQENLKL